MIDLLERVSTLQFIEKDSVWRWRGTPMERAYAQSGEYTIVYKLQVPSGTRAQAKSQRVHTVPVNKDWVRASCTPKDTPAGTKEARIRHFRTR